MSNTWMLKPKNNINVLILTSFIYQKTERVKWDDRFQLKSILLKIQYIFRNIFLKNGPIWQRSCVHTLWNCHNNWIISIVSAVKLSLGRKTASLAMSQCPDYQLSNRSFYAIRYQWGEIGDLLKLNDNFWDRLECSGYWKRI